jgi:hypothetical protein
MKIPASQPHRRFRNADRFNSLNHVVDDKPLSLNRAVAAMT